MFQPADQSCKITSPTTNASVIGDNAGAIHILTLEDMQSVVPHVMLLGNDTNASVISGNAGIDHRKVKITNVESQRTIRQQHHEDQAANANAVSGSAGAGEVSSAALQQFPPS